MPGSAPVLYPRWEGLDKDLGMGHPGEVAFYPISASGGGGGGSQRVGGIALPKKWGKSLFQEDTDVNTIML